VRVYLLQVHDIKHRNEVLTIAQKRRQMGLAALESEEEFVQLVTAGGGVALLVICWGSLGWPRCSGCLVGVGSNIPFAAGKNRLCELRLMRPS